MDEKKWTPDEKWEQEVLERFAEESDPLELLDLAGDCAVKLVSRTNDLRHTDPENLDIYDGIRELRKTVARMAVMLDALQLRFGEAVDEEIAFLQQIENAIE